MPPSSSLPLAAASTLALVALAAASPSAPTPARVSAVRVGDDPSIEPYAYLNNGAFSGPAVPLSPDPLVAYRWGSGANLTDLQLYDVLPVSAALMPGTPVSSFAGLASLTTALPSVTASGAGSFTVDFATESAAWVEVDSPDIAAADAALLSLGFSEWAGEALKQQAPKRYGNTFRLETNDQLYEGVRYGFVTLSAAPSAPFTITAVRAVSQAKPVNYTGAFAASGDDLLTRIWYTAVYTVRLNLERDYFGAILVDRGDRISWTGDAHVAQATALAAFGNYAFVLQNLARSATDCNGIESYCIYWCLSLIDYYEASGDKASLAQYTPNVADKLEHAYAIFDDLRTGLTFFGWDDRLGSGFMNASYMETQWDFRFLVLRAWSDWAATMSVAGNATGAEHFRGYVSEKSAWLRAQLGGDLWPSQLGTHAAAEAVNAPGFATAAEVSAILATQLDDSVHICSLSNFNQYWLLQALGNAGAMDKAVASVHRCWGAEIALGATAFWEISHPDWLLAFPTGPASSVPHPMPYGENGQTSLCHPWSAGAAPWLTANVLGIAPLAPGFASASVAPHITSQMAAAGGLRGSVPTPRGAVSINVDVAAASTVTVTAPAGVDIQLRLSEVLVARLGWPAGANVSVDGGAPFALAPEAGAARGPLFEGELAARGAGRSRVAVIELRGGGTFRVALAKEGGAAAAEGGLAAEAGGSAAPPFPPPSWPARVVAIDTWTQGNWIGRFGSQGYALAAFSNSSTGPDVMKLPSWIASVKQYRDSNTWLLPDPNADVRALQDPASRGRAIGCWYASCTNFVDVWMDASAEAAGLWWQLAVYLVDYDYGQASHENLRPRQATVALLNMHSLENAAPVQYLDNYVGGAWVVFELNTSARIRVSQLQGDNAVVSAVMFDAVSAS